MAADYLKKIQGIIDSITQDVEVKIEDGVATLTRADRFLESIPAESPIHGKFTYDDLDHLDDHYANYEAARTHADGTFAINLFADTPDLKTVRSTAKFSRDGHLDLSFSRSTGEGKDTAYCDTILIRRTAREDNGTLGKVLKALNKDAKARYGDK